MSPWFGAISGPKEPRLQPNARNPLADHPRILQSCHRSIATATAGEEELARLLIGRSDVTVDRLTGLFRHLEPDGVTGLLVADSCLVDSVTTRSNVLHPLAYCVACSELAIDG